VSSFLIKPFTRTFDIFGDGQSAVLIGPDNKLLTHAEWQDLKGRVEATYDRLSKAEIVEHNARIKAMPGAKA